MGKRLDVGIADVQEYYSEIGSDITEMLCEEGFLSICGQEGARILASKARITRESRVLDIGSGLGGAACYLAKTHGCRVTGLDVTEVSYSEAIKRSKARRLDHLVDFKLGSGLDIPFRANTFNVVWGLDAWAHVTDKDRLIGECGRVLEPGGTIAFTDWTEIGEMEETFRQQVLVSMACPYLETFEGYLQLLEKHGLSVSVKEEISEDFVQAYRKLMERLRGNRDTLVNRYGKKIYEIVEEKNLLAMKAFEERKIGGGRFIGKRRGGER